MGFDALASAAATAAASAATPRDIAGAARKKRGNRSAKLKQCKLDARREQWISQVKPKVTRPDILRFIPRRIVPNWKSKDTVKRQRLSNAMSLDTLA